jgi:hypothetical protein
MTIRYYDQESGVLEPVGSPEKTRWLRSLPPVFQEIVLEDWIANKLIDPSKLPEIVSTEPS